MLPDTLAVPLTSNFALVADVVPIPTLPPASTISLQPDASCTLNSLGSFILVLPIIIAVLSIKVFPPIWTIPFTFAVPVTCKFAPGVLVPMPTESAEASTYNV